MLFDILNESIETKEREEEQSFNILKRNKRGKNENLFYLEDLIGSLQMNPKDTNTDKSIERILNRIYPDIICENVIVTDNKANFFGMSVYPSDESLKKIIGNLNGDKNNYKVKYLIEIDKQLLTNKVARFTPGEITAILLHEIGHIYNENAIIIEIQKSFSRLANMTGSNIYKLVSTGNEAVHTALKLMILSCHSKVSAMQRGSKKQFKIEKEADKFVIEAGYSDELHSALVKTNKILSKSLDTYSDADFDDEAKLFLTVKEMMDGRIDSVESLYAAEKKTNGILFVDELINNILKYTGKNKYKQFRESYIGYKPLTVLDEILSESFMDKLMTNPIKISQIDIDEIKIEMEMMEDYDDKMVVMYRIHKRLAQVAEAKSKIEKKYNDSKKEQFINIINSYEQQLRDMLKKTMEYKVIEKSYGVFIKYPKGYEG